MVLFKSTRIEHNKWLTAFFIISFVPVSFAGYGVNYLFALLPIFFLVFGRGLKRLDFEVFLFQMLCLFVFTLANLYQSDVSHYGIRRFVSFILFLSQFTLCFIDFNINQLRSFRIATVTVATLYSLYSTFVFLSLGTAGQNFESKDIVGTQRTGFLLILGFWVLVYQQDFLKHKIIRNILLFTMVLGIILTFSRASTLAFTGSILIAFFLNLSQIRRKFLQTQKIFLLSLIFLLSALTLIYYIAPVIYEFNFVRLIDYVLSGRVFIALENQTTSDGTRLFIWSNISGFIYDNPFTGAGFLGVWVLNLFGNGHGSAHSQYFDVLFRIGPFLFLFYCYFLYKIIKFGKSIDKGLFVGLCGVYIYGIFHETYKESHGAFLFAFILAITYSRQLKHYAKHQCKGFRDFE